MPKLLYFVTEDWYFCSHRLQLALAAKRIGYDVAVITRVSKKRETIENAGIRVIPITLKRRSANPFNEFWTFCSLMCIFWRERPDIVHNVALKPVLYGSMAAFLTGVPHVVNALAGMGYLFVSDTGKFRLLRMAITSAFRLLLNLKGSQVIVQNPDDRKLMIHARMVGGERVSLIRGAGVDTEAYGMSPEPQGELTVLFASRMLWNKGVGEFVEAAGILRGLGIKCRFILVGEPDLENPLSVPLAQLAYWKESGMVDWWGRRDDMPQIFTQCHIVCLPSYYGEGIPKVLIEAASSGRPIVTTDTPGCREIVRHGENGFLVPPKDVKALTQALQYLITNPEQRELMGRRGREIVIKEFAVEKVIAETLAVYGEMMDQF